GHGQSQANDQAHAVILPGQLAGESSTRNPGARVTRFAFWRAAERYVKCGRGRPERIMWRSCAGASGPAPAARGRPTICRNSARNRRSPTPSEGTSMADKPGSFNLDDLA